MEPYYQQDGITIYHGDCREVLPTLGRFDLLLTDPPYGIGAAKDSRFGTQWAGAAAPTTAYEKQEWDNEINEGGVMDAISCSRWQIVWGGNYYMMMPSPCWLVWDKDNGANTFADCELAWTNLDRAVRKFKWKWQGMLQEKAGDRKEARQHPTQKPLPLMQWCLSLVPDAETMVDSFMGSGTSLVAAKLAGIEATGIEINERYCEIAANRLRQGVFDFAEVT